MNYEELARSLYPPKADDPDFFPPSGDYQPMIDHFGTVAVQVDDRGYHGDSRILYSDDGRGFGYLQFGWGSCSGCDALQYCRNYRDLAELLRDLDSQIKWLPRDEMLSFFRTHDFFGDYDSGQRPEQREFVDKAIAHLEGIA